ncbi:hypothetical protein, partial [Klebsiella aerogenes]|uniref:hypothetical protein n=1 Tax=Klebsiella aerogenes TaxID=548 RepID=UPI001D0D6FD1
SKDISALLAGGHLNLALTWIAVAHRRGSPLLTNKQSPSVACSWKNSINTLYQGIKCKKKPQTLGMYCGGSVPLI